MKCIYFEKSIKCFQFSKKNHKTGALKRILLENIFQKLNTPRYRDPPLKGFNLKARKVRKAQ